GRYLGKSVRALGSDVQERDRDRPDAARGRGDQAGLDEPATVKAIGFRFIGDLIRAGWSITAACELMGVHRTSWYRHQNPAVPAGVQVPQKERDYPSRITTAEADAFMALLNSEDYENLSVTQAYRRMSGAGPVPLPAPTAHRVGAGRGHDGDARAP